MATFLANVLTSDPAITIYSIIVIILLGYVVRKFPGAKKYTDIAVDIFAFIEDNYKTWGIRGNEKLEFFVKDFVARYQKEFGKVPTEEIIRKAVELVEQLVAAQNRIAKSPLE
jgi:hypothetical protein